MPTSRTWPDCSSPRRLPAPRMSRSWLATEKPAPNWSSDCRHLQPAFGRFGQLPIRRRREICIGTLLGASDTAAQLIKLREAEHVGAMHDQRVRGRDIETAFHDIGGDQHIHLAVIECRHHVFERAGRHLAVTDRGLHFRHSLFQEFLRLAQIGDARADIEALSAAIMLAQQRLADHQRVERRHEGAHGKAIDGRGRDQ